MILLCPDKLSRIYNTNDNNTTIIYKAPEYGESRQITFINF